MAHGPLVSISALRLTSSFVTLCGQYTCIFNILLRLLCMKVSIMFSSFSFIFQVSLPYRRTDRMLELKQMDLVLFDSWL